MLGVIGKAAAAARSTTAVRLVSASSRLQRTSLQGTHWRSYHASSVTPKSASPATESDTIDSDGGEPPVQPFVKQKINPQEWDPIAFRNPLYHPTYKARSKVLSNEDFQRRPTVRFDDSFESMADAQVVFSHITHREMQAFYDEYKINLGHAHAKYGVTSHEYIVRVLAQKYSMQAPRMAAIIQLMSNEEDMRKNGEELRDEFGEYMDYALTKEIADCYRAHGMKPPQQPFVEQPMGRDIKPPSKRYNQVPDTVDMDETWRKYTEEHLPLKARKIIQSHRYVEDEDDDKVPIPNDKEVLGLIDKHDELQTKMENHFRNIELSDRAKEHHKLYDPPRKKKRKIKWVAQIVNTRQLQKEKKAQKRRPDRTWKNKSRLRMSVQYSNDSPKNTLVNEEGKLRVGTLEDVKNVAWKPKRRDYGEEMTMEATTATMEFIYRGAKLKWLDQVKGRTSKNKQRAVAASAEEEAKEDAVEEEEDTPSSEDDAATEDAATEEDDTATTESEEGNDKPSS